LYPVKRQLGVVVWYAWNQNLTMNPEMVRAEKAKFPYFSLAAQQ
jgi:hypothetical protein